MSAVGTGGGGKILCVRSGATSRNYSLDRPLTIGRAPDNDVQLDDAEVSRYHAVLSPGPEGYVFKDLGSANGSYLGSGLIEPRVPTVLGSGMGIRVGPYLLEIQGVSAPAPALLDTMPRRSSTVEATLRAWLQITMTGRAQRTVELVDEAVTVGRDPDNTIALSTDVVSRHHLVMRRTGQGFAVQDLGSTNGFRVNGVQVAAGVVADGDVIDIAGEVQLRLSFRPEVEAGQEERLLDLQGRRAVTIGRDPACDIRVDHPTVSLTHARIEVSPGAAGTAVEDLDSRNGTFVNGKRLERGERRAISAGDIVQVGPMRFVLGAHGLEQRDYSQGMGLAAVALAQRVNRNVNLLQDVSFVIQPQEFVAVVGVSGAGKSTLLGAMSGLRPASEGQILLNGVSLYENYDALRTILGYVPQDDILHRELPVERALGYAAELRLPDDTGARERRMRVDSVIRELGLDEQRALPVGRLSGGQRKRVSIGAELLTAPGLFFLDEATSGLDPGTESQLMRLLRSLADVGHTIVLVTHATKNVMLCDQVLFLARGGHLAYYGPPDEALTYFGVTDFDGIYEKLEASGSPEEWGARYRTSAQCEAYVNRRLAGLPAPAAGAGGHRLASNGAAPSVPSGSGSSSFRQLSVLFRRYADILRRDRIALLLLFLLAPVLGSIDLIAWPRHVLDERNGIASRAMAMLFVGSLVPFLVGGLTFVREIVKESAIYARERAVALKVWPYLASKVIMALPMAIYHAAALFALKWLAIDFGRVDAVDLGAMYVTLVLAVWSGAIWGLLISTITRREEQAMMLIVGVIVVQIVFSGGLVPLDSLGTAGTLLGGATSTAWAFKAIVASAGLNSAGCSGDFSQCRLPGIAKLGTQPERQLQFANLHDAFSGVFDANVVTCWVAMLAIMVVIGVVLYMLQKRKDLL